MDMVANLSGRQKAIVGLTVATAVIHIILAIMSRSETMFLVLFLLNGLGYLALLSGLYFLPSMAGQRSMIRLALMGFTAITVVLYFVFNWPDVWAPMGIVDKLIEIILIVLLWQDQ